MRFNLLTLIATLVAISFIIDSYVLSEKKDELKAKIERINEQNELLKVFVSSHGYNIPKKLDHDYIIKSSNLRNTLCEKEANLADDYSTISIDKMLKMTDDIKTARGRLLDVK